MDKTSYQPGFDQSIVELMSQYVLNPMPRDAATGEITYGLWDELPILAEVPAGGTT